MGLTKVCSVAEEVCKPKRNIPLGIFLAWGVVSALYVLVVYVTVGLLELLLQMQACFHLHVILWL